MGENEPTSNRRQLLRTITVGLAAATAGCAVEVGDYRIGVDETDDSTPSPTPGADEDPTPTETASSTPTGTDSPGETDAIPASELSAGDLVINEVMVDPYATSDEDGEWFEVYNARSEPVDLAGLVVRDEFSNDSHTVAESLVVQPGGYVVFVASRLGAEEAGFTADYVYDDVDLSNTGDELVLANGSAVIDYVSWDTSSRGYSWSLDPRHQDAADNDDPIHWCDAVLQLPSGDFGTPGDPNSRC